MKIALVNTYDRNGGAAIACQRLLLAHLHCGVEATMLVQDKKTDIAEVTGLTDGFFLQKKALLRFGLERLYFWRLAKDKSVRYAFSPANTGIDISRHPLIQEADIIHLHWINFGFLSLRNLRQLIATKKPIVWTLHDMWAFTGGCHYAGDCTHYYTSCHDCHFLKSPSPKDLSFKVYSKKMALLKDANVSFVTCSDWLRTMAKQSALLQDKSLVNIPNPIDTKIFRPLDEKKCRGKYNLPFEKALILFGAMNIADTRKGFVHFKKAIQHIVDSKAELVIFGKAEEALLEGLPIPVHALGKIPGKDMQEIYNACDLFVLPSLEDNLPNTIMEAMACGTPCVAFEMGGVPEMVEHQTNGYLAKYKDAKDLANGILYVIDHAKRLSEACLLKVERCFSQKIVSAQYLDFYKSKINQ